MNDVLRIARLKIALQGAFLGRAILIFTLMFDEGGLRRDPFHLLFAQSMELSISNFLYPTPQDISYHY